SSPPTTVPPPTEPYTLPLHDALPISQHARRQYSHNADGGFKRRSDHEPGGEAIGQKENHADGKVDSGCDDDQGLRHRHKGEQYRSEEHTSELQSRENLVCRLLLDKKK